MNYEHFTGCPALSGGECGCEAPPTSNELSELLNQAMAQTRQTLNDLRDLRVMLGLDPVPMTGTRSMQNRIAECMEEARNPR